LVSTTNDTNFRARRNIAGADAQVIDALVVAIASIAELSFGRQITAMASLADLLGCAHRWIDARNTFRHRKGVGAKRAKIVVSAYFDVQDAVGQCAWWR
jgi:hypothetical protein